MAWDYGASGLDDFCRRPLCRSSTDRATRSTVYYCVWILPGHGCGASSDCELLLRSIAICRATRSGEFPRVCLRPPSCNGSFPTRPPSRMSPRTAPCVHACSFASAAFPLARGCDNGDGGQTPGVASFLLIDHTWTRSGSRAAARGLPRVSSPFLAGTPYSLGGNPNPDSLRYEFMSGTEHVDPATGSRDGFPCGAAPSDWTPSGVPVGPIPRTSRRPRLRSR